MLKVLLIVAAVLAVLLVATLVLAATKPDSFQVQRTATIKAPPAEIAAVIEDFQTWGRWSPYEKVDPDMKRTYSGPQAGPGAVYEWDGNNNIGAGRMEILTSSPGGVGIDFRMSRPLVCHNEVAFTLEPAGDATTVTWRMRGPNTYFGKVIQTFVSMDRMVGSQQEEGLENLKRLLEGSK